MAKFGYYTTSSYANGGIIEDEISLLAPLYVGVDGSLTKITFMKYTSVGKTEKFKAALYENTSGNNFSLIAETLETIYSSSDGLKSWLDCNFSSSVGVSVSKTYGLAVWADSTTDSSNYYYYDTAGATGFILNNKTNVDYSVLGAFPSTLGPSDWFQSNVNYAFHVYGTYTLGEKSNIESTVLADSLVNYKTMGMYPHSYNTSNGGTIEDVVTIVKATAPSDGVLEKICVYIENEPSKTLKVKGALYSNYSDTNTNDFAIVQATAETNWTSPVTYGPVWIDLPFATTVPVIGGHKYGIAVWADYTSYDAYKWWESNTGGWYGVFSRDYSAVTTYPDTITNANYSIKSPDESIHLYAKYAGLQQYETRLGMPINAKNGADLNDYLCLIRATPTASGTLTKITVRTGQDLNTQPPKKAALYDYLSGSSFSLIAETVENSWTTSEWSNCWLDFTFSTGVQITVSHEYGLALWADNNTGTQYIYYTDFDATGLTNYKLSLAYSTASFPSTISSWSATATNIQYSIFGTYFLAGTENFYNTNSETLILGDVFMRQLPQRTFGDTVLIPDQYSRKLTAYEPMTDTVWLPDNFGRKETAYRSITDTLLGADSFIRKLTSYEVYTDYVWLEDIFTRKLTALETVIDYAWIADTFVRKLTAYEYITDTTLLADNFLRKLTAYEYISDTLLMADTFIKQMTFMKTFSDAIYSIDGMSKMQSIILSEAPQYVVVSDDGWPV